jgi:hypothetical protein
MDFIIDLHTKFNHILFKDDDHTYTNVNTGKKYDSGTGFIKYFQKPYDSNYYAEKKAIKTGRDKQEYLDMWANKSLVGRTRGTIIHKFNEDLWRNKQFPVDNPNWILSMPTDITIDYLKSINILKEFSVQFWNDYKNIYVPISLEPVIGDDEWNIATMVDMIAYDLQTREYGIIDYKTDAGIDYYSIYKNKMLDPLTHMDDCNMNKYSIQTEISKRILEKHCNVEIKFRKIVWYNKNNDTYKIIDCLDVNKEVDLMLECYG